MVDVVTTLPDSLTCGDTWVWDRDLANYPRPTWSATAYFESQSAAFNVASTSSPAITTGQRFTIPAATTAGYAAGRYKVTVRVTDGTSTFTAETAWVDVTVDPAKAGNQDPRSWARRTLDAVEAFLEGNATTAQQSMSIQGRSINRWSLAELTQFRSQLRGEVRTEEQGSNAGLGRNIKARMARG